MKCPPRISRDGKAAMGLSVSDAARALLVRVAAQKAPPVRA
jgi:antitoxin component of RelBE/YafQ-DinJ toxin-antitoxin module